MKQLLSTLILLWFISGCHYTTVDLEDPSGSVLTYDGVSYVFPSRVEFQRPGDLGDSYLYPITLSFPTATGGTMTVSGELEVFGYIEHQTDIINPHQFRLTLDEIGQLSNGQRVVHISESKSGYKIFKMDLRP